MIVTFATIIVNALVGKDVGKVSDELNLEATPAGFTFSIWGVIYTAVTGMTIHYTVKQPETNWTWYYLSCFANSGWIVSWVNKQFVLSAILIVAIVASLFAFFLSLKNVVYKNIISLYLSWVAGATLLNISAVFRSTSDVDVSGYLAVIGIPITHIAWQFWACPKASVPFPFVGLWTSIGILAKTSAVWSWGVFSIVSFCCFKSTITLFYEREEDHSTYNEFQERRTSSRP